jgi:hypothetical protein
MALLADVVVRTRLARGTAESPGSLYFVGFFVRVLTLEPIGVVAGPLVVGLFVESAALLSSELHPERRRRGEGGDVDAVDAVEDADTVVSDDES